MLKLVCTIFSLSISNLSTLDFKLAESVFLANFDVLTPTAFLKSTSFAQLDKSNSTFNLPPKDFGSGIYSVVYIMLSMSIFINPTIKDLS